MGGFEGTGDRSSDVTVNVTANVSSIGDIGTQQAKSISEKLGRAMKVELNWIARLNRNTVHTLYRHSSLTTDAVYISNPIAGCPDIHRGK